MKTVVSRIRPWRHDLAGCLHACAATLLDHEGMPALETLGARWGFYYPPGDFRQEEYYLPCRPGTTLLASLAPYHPVSSCWHVPVDAAQGWSEVRARVASGTPVAVSVDNYWLPFRPAYQDVHANHLVIVYGFDDEGAEEQRHRHRHADRLGVFADGATAIRRGPAARDTRRR